MYDGNNTSQVNFTFSRIIHYFATITALRKQAALLLFVARTNESSGKTMMVSFILK